MKFLFTIHPEAREEVLRDIAYLEKSRAGYGDLFNLRIDEAIEKIITHPKRYEEMIKGKGRYRILLDKPFNKSYSIYHDFDGEMVHIISVFNNSRSDTIWKDRERD